MSNCLSLSLSLSLPPSPSLSFSLLIYDIKLCYPNACLSRKQMQPGLTGNSQGITFLLLKTKTYNDY